MQGAYLLSTEVGRFQVGLRSQSSSASHPFAFLYLCWVKAIPCQFIEYFNKDQLLRGKWGVKAYRWKVKAEQLGLTSKGKEGGVEVGSWAELGCFTWPLMPPPPNLFPYSADIFHFSWSCCLKSCTFTDLFGLWKCKRKQTAPHGRFKGPHWSLPSAFVFRFNFKF